MTFDDAIAAFAAATALPREAMEWVLDNWEQTGPLCRDLVDGYVSGRDQSERTEQALFVVFHLLGEKADTAIFAPLCRLLRDPERASLVFGEDGLMLSVPPLQISTFDGDPAPLYALSDDPAADVKLRGDALLVLAYLARTKRISESELYRHLAAMPDRVVGEAASDLWFGWVSAVGGMGFAGLAAQAEAMFQDGRVDPEAFNPADFWDDLRDARENPGQTSGAIWTGLHPLGSAVQFLGNWTGEDDEDDVAWAPPVAEPIRNPLRDVGRNDPCPCGSGKKYKKCCLTLA